MSQNSQLAVWHLKKGSEKKFRSGHPWIFSNELAQSPKGLPQGAEVELRDFQGNFLARGYGHPNSLIAFRTLTVREDEALSVDFFFERLKSASHLRQISGLNGFSHRLCFAEGDYLPGLIIDRYFLSGSQGQVFVVQTSTAGMDRRLGVILQALEKLVTNEGRHTANAVNWSQTSVVIANDSKSRLMENLAVEPKRVEISAAGFRPEAARLVIQPGRSDLRPLIFEADLIGGQKTGFFLDQRFNVQLASHFISGLFDESRKTKSLRVLDLCCYIGQWGAQMANLASAMGVKAEVTCVDASQHALNQAAKNVEAHGGEARVEKMDVLDGLERIERSAFDVVICDPPAFIKKKKDLPTGSQAYFKMNREAVRKTVPGGFFISCSCSGLFTEEDFRSMLAKVSATSGTRMRWVARGGHSPDHPQRPEFPQGTYLKSWMGFSI